MFSISQESEVDHHHRTSSEISLKTILHPQGKAAPWSQIVRDYVRIRQLGSRTDGWPVAGDVSTDPFFGKKHEKVDF